jgi:hypothetical protein
MSKPFVMHGDEPFDGCIVGSSEELLALAVLDHGIRYDGVVVLRKASIQTIVNPHPQSDFYETVLARRHGVNPPRRLAEQLTWIRCTHS